MSHIPERRKNKDRRQVDLGPPAGCEERRQQIERRHPQVTEVDFDEWEALINKRDKDDEPSR